MRISLALGLSALLLASPAAAQYVAPGIGSPVTGAPVSGVPVGAGGTSAAFGGGTMGPYSGSVPGGASSAAAGGTMGPSAGGGVPGAVNGAGYQPALSGYNSGLNVGSLGAFNSGSLSTTGSSFANQSAIQPLQYAAPAASYAIPSIVPMTSTGAFPSAINAAPVDTFTTTPSTGFAIPQAGANVTGTIRNSAGVLTQP